MYKRQTFLFPDAFDGFLAFEKDELQETYGPMAAQARSRKEDGRMEAIQLAAELASLSGFGSGGMGVLGEVRDTLGFDVLRFGSMQNGPKQQTSRNVGLLQPPGQNSGSSAQEDSIPSLEVGKYVMDNVYVGLEQGMNGDASGVRVEIELAPNLNLEGVSTPQGSEVGLNWKKDY